jgi:hypothetical protein
MSPELRHSYSRLRRWQVREVLGGGTIYLFDFPNPAQQKESGDTVVPPP